MSMMPSRDGEPSTKRRELSRRKFLQRSLRGMTAGAVGVMSTRSIFGGVAEAQAPMPAVGGGDPLPVDGLGPQQLMLDGTFEYRGQPLDTNHAWSVRLMDPPPGGAFVLTADRATGPPCTTTPLACDASAGDVEAALRALPNLQKATVRVRTHASAFVIMFEPYKKTAVLTAQGVAHVGSEQVRVRVDKLNVWSGPKDAVSTIVNNASHGRQCAEFRATGTTVNAWRGPFVPCLPGEVLSVGADNRITRGGASWTIGVGYYTRAFVEITGSGYRRPAHHGDAWARRTGTAPGAPTGTAWAAFVLRRHELGAADGDTLQLDAVLMVPGTYTGPMLPALITVGDVKPDGFLVSAYAGLGCDRIRARLYRDGTEVAGRSPTQTGVVQSGWAFTRAVGLEPATDYRMQLEARNATSQAWERFGELI